MENKLTFSFFRSQLHELQAELKKNFKDIQLYPPVSGERLGKFFPSELKPSYQICLDTYCAALAAIEELDQTLSNVEQLSNVTKVLIAYKEPRLESCQHGCPSAASDKESSPAPEGD